MINFIQHLQQKPLRQKKQIAFFASVALTGVIVLFWLVGVANREPKPVQAAGADAGPASAFSEQLGEFFRDSKEVASRAANVFSSFKKASDEASVGGSLSAPDEE